MRRRRRAEVTLAGIYHEQAVLLEELTAARLDMAAFGLTLSDGPQTIESLTARVSQMRAEVTAMNLALDEGRDPCQCGSWFVTWDSAHSRWICSGCADSDYELYQIGPEGSIARHRGTGMQGISTGLCIYDEVSVTGVRGLPETSVWQDHFRPR